MATKRRMRSEILQGGVRNDGTSHERMFRDLENLLAVPGAGKAGVFPREGISPLAQFTTAAPAGCRVFIVRDSSDNEHSIIGVHRVATGEIKNLWDHRDLKGRVRPTEWPYPDVRDPYVSAVISYESSSTTATTIKVMGYNQRSGTRTVYLIGGFTRAGEATYGGTGAPHNYLFRVGPDLVCLTRRFQTTAGSGEFVDMHLDFYRISDIEACPAFDGVAAQPVGSVFLGSFYNVLYGSAGPNAAIPTQMRFAPCQSGELVVYSGRCPAGIDLTLPDESTTPADPYQSTAARRRFGWIGVIDLTSFEITHSSLVPARFRATMTTTSGTTTSDFTNFEPQSSGSNLYPFVPLDATGYLHVMGNAVAGSNRTVMLRIAPKMKWDPNGWNDTVSPYSLIRTANVPQQGGADQVREASTTTDGSHSLLNNGNNLFTHNGFSPLFLDTYGKNLADAKIFQGTFPTTFQQANKLGICWHADGRVFLLGSSGADWRLYEYTFDYDSNNSDSYIEHASWPDDAGFWPWLMDDNRIFSQDRDSNQFLVWDLASGAVTTQSSSYLDSGTVSYVWTNLSFAVPDPFAYSMRHSATEVAAS